MQRHELFCTSGLDVCNRNKSMALTSLCSHAENLQPRPALFFLVREEDAWMYRQECHVLLLG